MKNKNNKMGLTLVSLSFLFFFLPDFTVIDLLPDAFGFLLLILGLTKISDLNESVAEARTILTKISLVAIVKLLMVMFIFSLSSEVERATSILVALFVYAVFDVIWLIPAYIKLFDGLIYLDSRADGTVSRAVGKSGKSLTDRIRRLTVAFVVAKNAFAIIPETLSLSTSSGDLSYQLEYYDYTGILRILCMTASLIFGVVWLVKILRYFGAVKSDTELLDALSERYEKEILTNETIFIRRRVKASALFFMAGAVFAIDFYFEGNNGYNLIPDILCAVCFIIGLVIVRKMIQKPLMQASLGLFAFYGIMTTVNWFVVKDFAYEYTAREVNTRPDAYSAWIKLVVMSSIEAIAFLLCIAAFAAVLKRIVDTQTGFVPRHATIDPVQKLKETHKKMYAYIIVFCSFSLLAAAGGVFRVVTFRMSGEIADASWIIELAVTAVFSFTAALATLRIGEQVEEKYMLS